MTKKEVDSLREEVHRFQCFSFFFWFVWAVMQTRLGADWDCHGYALSRCGASAEHTWFCGDNPQADVEGSSAAGMYPVWYDSDIECPYRDKERESTPSCDMLRIREWSEMTGLLELL